MKKKQKLMVINHDPDQLAEAVNKELNDGWIIKSEKLYTITGLYVHGHMYRGIIILEKKG